MVNFRFNTAYLFFLSDCPLFVLFFINICEYKNYAKKIVSIFDDGLNYLSLNFNLALNLIVYD